MAKKSTTKMPMAKKDMPKSMPKQKDMMMKSKDMKKCK